MAKVDKFYGEIVMAMVVAASNIVVKRFAFACKCGWGHGLEGCCCRGMVVSCIVGCVVLLLIYWSIDTESVVGWWWFGYCFLLHLMIYWGVCECDWVDSIISDIYNFFILLVNLYIYIYLLIQFNSNETVRILLYSIYIIK